MKKFILFLIIAGGTLFFFWAKHRLEQTPTPLVPAPEPPVVTVPDVPATTRPPAPTTTTRPVRAPGSDTGERALIPGPMDLYATYSAVSVEFSYSGDANTNATARLSWRRVGDTAWRPGVEPTVDRARQLMWASIWPLEQGESIEVQLELLDPLPLPEPRLGRIRTQRMLLSTSGGRTVYVNPVGGQDSHPGTQEMPFKTLAKALEGAAAGDTIYAMSGIYPESIYLEYVKATAEQPIVITAAPGHKPVLDSSLTINPGAGWSTVAPGVFAIGGKFSEEGPGYVAQDGKRMYRYETVEALEADEFGNKRAWAYDAARQRLVVRPGAGKPAGAHRYQVSRHDFGILLEGCRHFVISGFEMRYYGSYCVRLSGPRGAGHVIYGNTLHNSQQAVFIKSEGTTDAAVWNNLIYEPGLRDFSWNSIKSSHYARQGVNILYAGRGMSVCHNKVHDWFDGIVLLSWNQTDNLALNRDSDIMFNTLWNFGDDAIEVDGGGVNMRVHGNRIRNAHSAISAAPVERGPVYITRNDATFHTLFFKMSVGVPSLGWTYLYHNSGYTLDAGNGATMVRFNDPRWGDANRVVKNNAIIGSEFAVHRARPNHVLDYNCYFNTPTTGYRKFQWDGEVYPRIEAFSAASGQEMHGLYADPLFRDTPDLGKYQPHTFPLHADASIGDLRPQAASPLIDRGVRIPGVSDDYAGAAPDIGAFEFAE